MSTTLKNLHLLLLIAMTTSCGLKSEFNTSTIRPGLPEIPLKIRGCQDSMALNYNRLAEEEDGSCSFKGCTLFDENLKNSYAQYKIKFPTSSLENTCPSPVTDVHNQSNRPHVGILWVIDNSYSMEPEIKNIANNFNSFINEFLNSPIDFSMGITTTDSKHVSSSIGTLTSEAARLNRAQFIQKFKQLINVGTNGSSTEQGYQAAYDFIDKYSSEFLRLPSYLSIIFVSDEADQSNKSPQEYLDYYASHVSNIQKVRTHAILDLNNSGGDDDTKGSRYLYSVNKTGGIKGDVDSSFSQILKDIGSNLINLKKSFGLSSKPYLPTLVVSLNGQIITNWTYNATENSVTIIPAPDFNAEIKISYTPAP